MPADPVPADPVPADPVPPETARPETAPPTTARPVNTEQGGDPVCWMHLLCQACGAMPDPEQPEWATCPRCGEERDR